MEYAHVGGVVLCTYLWGNCGVGLEGVAIKCLPEPSTMRPIQDD